MKSELKGWKAEIEIDDAKTLCFPNGMVGFPEAKKYVVLNSGRGDIVCFQSTEQTEASFLMTPWDEDRLGPTPSLSPDQKAALKYSDKHNILWLLVLNPFADKDWVLANLKAPVALNQNTGFGMQCIQANTNLELRHQWMPQPPKADDKKAA
ncbi:flagellar assembly factor FliW [Mariprofundus ferrinatatus]|uniref:Flagellar assembly factor FliW n=1 Tax=Mariprofundus ferrinatatus TaxID=1921087 RepID=A0A2K8LDH0_9PROT|nr:flagellar assembly protein FliW [Mariprofundus ferrinatatus]ATX82954.1 flagellar assembly factor FliW [Mariprofundus ferrinatatus]